MIRTFIKVAYPTWGKVPPGWCLWREFRCKRRDREQRWFPEWKRRLREIRAAASTWPSRSSCKWGRRRRSWCRRWGWRTAGRSWCCSPAPAQGSGRRSARLPRRPARCLWRWPRTEPPISFLCKKINNLD